MRLTRGRVRVLLTSAWVATMLSLYWFAGIPAWLMMIANVAGGGVIYRYVQPFPDAPLSRWESVLTKSLYVILGTVAALGLLIVILLIVAVILTLFGS